MAASPTGLVGYSFGVPRPDRPEASLLGLAVHPDHRNLGYGTRLTRGTLNQLSNMGIETVYLTVEPDNDPAIRLYRALGFTDAGYRKHYFGPGEHRLLMTRRLPGIPTPRPDGR